MPFAIDMFCGAGGFSEGILQAGFDIVFSSDKSPMVESTYTNRHRQLGLQQGIDTYFELADIHDLSSSEIFEKINSLKYGKIFKPGSIDVMFGGPPCQGFSRLGKRDPSDPRNMLFHEYIRIIKDIKPKYVVMENVTGILDMQMLDFPSVLSQGQIYEGQNLIPYILRTELTSLNYTVLDMQVLNAEDFGVPQRRRRAIFLAYRNDVAPISYPKPTGPHTTVSDALGDLYSNKQYSSSFSLAAKKGRTLSQINHRPIARKSLTNMETSQHDRAVRERFSIYKCGENKRKVLSRIRETGIDLQQKAPELFYETLYQVNSEANKKVLTEELSQLGLGKNFQDSKLWLNHTNKELSNIAISEQLHNSNDLKRSIHALGRRLDIADEEVVVFLERLKPKLNPDYSAKHLNDLFKAGNINDVMADAVFTKKGIRSRLDPEDVAPTMVTLPDDFIHPYFDRVLTVREMARIQSFDDSFEFLGKRTTGGSMRAKETPQFTQVGNAVPPLLARAIALEARHALEVNN